MRTLKISLLALLGFASVSCAWYVNRWDYDSAYIRGLGDGGRVGFVKGYLEGMEDVRAKAAAPIQSESTATQLVEVSG